MHRRVSIASLMVLILAIAIELALLRVASEQSARALVNLTVLLLIGSAFLARYRRGYTGAWWFGFALFGSGYLGMAELFGRRLLLGEPLILGLEPLMSRLWPEASAMRSVGGPGPISASNDAIDAMLAIVVQLIAVLGGFAGLVAHRMLGPAENPGDAAAAGTSTEEERDLRGGP